MSHKMMKIRILKDKLYTMQKQLKQLESHSSDKTISKDKKTKSKSNKNNNNTHKFYNPTLWGSNPILGQINITNKINQKYKRQKQPKLSPKLANILQNTTKQYYKQINTQQNNNSEEVTFRKINQFQNKENKNDTPRFKKIRTYQIEKTDPILSPRPSKSIGKKITKKTSCSPETMLYAHPNSNPNLYLYSTQPICLSPKNIMVNRNHSPNIRMILSSSVEDMNKSQKLIEGRRHFSRYFQQNYSYRRH